MNDIIRTCTLNSLVPVLIKGPDARTFLQGQLSNDLRKLTPDHALLASCNSPRGRTQAVLTLIERQEGILAVVSSATAQRLIARLSSYVLRSKVVFAENPGYLLAPLTATQAAGILETLPQVPGDCQTRGELSVLRWWSADERYLLLSPRESIQVIPDAEADLRWRRADISAGLPQVYPETHELFIAQMLNLDLLNGISFDKGCYTGQEIIARTQYRGTLKRRMMRFAADCAAPSPGTRVLCGDSHVGEVVDACIASAETGKACELLAVISLDRAEDELSLEGIPCSTLVRLGLPYAVPQARAA